jgi:hypothetical protein
VAKVPVSRFAPREAKFIWRHNMLRPKHNLNRAGQPAACAIEGAAAKRLDLGPSFGLSGRWVGGAVWPIFSRDHTAMDFSCVIAKARWDLRLSEISENGTGWHSVALFHRLSISPRSWFSAWAAGWPPRPRRARSASSELAVAPPIHARLTELESLAGPSVASFATPHHAFDLTPRSFQEEQRQERDGKIAPRLRFAPLGGSQPRICRIWPACPRRATGCTQRGI